MLLDNGKIYDNTKVYYGYNKSNNITNIVNLNINNQQLDSYRYEYDGSNRIVEDIYDDSIYNSSFNIKYSYDSNGNIFTKDILSKGEKYTYEYDTANPFLLKKIKLTKNNSESVFTELSYDSNNPLIINQIIRNNETININYQNGFITTIGSTSFEYNHLGQRIVKYDNENVTYYYYDDNNNLISSCKNNINTFYIYDDNNQLLGLKLNNEIYLYDRDILGNITGIIDKTGKLMIKFTYTAFGEPIINIPSTLSDDECIIVDQIVANNIFLYKGYVYDVETNLALVSSRYYSPELGRFIQPADVSSLNPQSINGLNLYTYAVNNPIAIKYDNSISSYGSGMVSSKDFGALSTGTSSVSNQAAPEWLKLLVGAIPDLKVGLDYLTAHGTKSSFAYATAKTYRFPILGGTHSAFTKGKYSYDDLVGASFRKITTDSARGGFGAFAKNFAKTSVYTLGVNFAFNLCENNWQIDDAMIKDTLIDTAIGVSSYYMAAGTMSLLTAGALVAFGWNVPGLIVVGGVVVLSIAYDALIRWITGYDE